MVKQLDPVKLERLEKDAAAGLAALTDTAPNARAGAAEFGVWREANEIDFALEVQVKERQSRLICEVKSDGRGHAARRAIADPKRGPTRSIAKALAECE